MRDVLRISKTQAVKILKERIEKDLGNEIEKLIGRPPGPDFYIFTAVMTHDIIYNNAKVSDHVNKYLASNVTLRNDVEEALQRLKNRSLQS